MDSNHDVKNSLMDSNHDTKNSLMDSIDDTKNRTFQMNHSIASAAVMNTCESSSEGCSCSCCCETTFGEPKRHCICCSRYPLATPAELSSQPQHQACRDCCSCCISNFIPHIAGENENNNKRKVAAEDKRRSFTSIVEPIFPRSGVAEIIPNQSDEFQPNFHLAAPFSMNSQLTSRRRSLLSRISVDLLESNPPDTGTAIATLSSSNSIRDELLNVSRVTSYKSIPDNFSAFSAVGVASNLSGGLGANHGSNPSRWKRMRVQKGVSAEDRREKMGDALTILSELAYS